MSDFRPGSYSAESMVVEILVWDRGFREVLVLPDEIDSLDGKEV